MDSYLIRTKAPSTSPKPKIKSHSTSIPSTSLLASRTSTSILGGRIKLDNKKSLRLKDSDNPITKSDLYERTLHLQSAASGHQSASGKGPGINTKWMELRAKKLKEQQLEWSNQQFATREDMTQCSAKGKERESSTQIDGEMKFKKNIFAGVVTWISGTTGEGVTDRQVKEAITIHGGEARMNLSSSCTHLISLQLSSGSKADRYLTAKAAKLKMVTPDWIFDSIKSGKRLSEAAYSIVYTEGQSSVYAICSGKPADGKKRKHVADYECGGDVPYSDSKPLPPPIRKKKVVEKVIESDEEDEWGAPPSCAQPRS